jgi:hypothetical protein
MLNQWLKYHQNKRKLKNYYNMSGATFGSNSTITNLAKCCRVHTLIIQFYVGMEGKLLELLWNCANKVSAPIEGVQEFM